MAQLIRVTLVNGETFIQQLPDGVTLPQWWGIVQADGAVIGETWCVRFGAVSHAAVAQNVDAAKPAEGQAQNVHHLPTFGPQQQAAPYFELPSGWKPQE